MDRQWMREQLSRYETLVSEYSAALNTYQPSDRDEREQLASQLRQLEPTAKAILQRLDPALSTYDFDTMSGDLDARAAAQRGLGVLAGMDDWATRLAPDAPTLPADQFHPWVWGAAHTLWESKHYRAAVEAAAKAINAHTQTKVGRRDLSDTNLMNQVLTADKPKTGQVYLQLPGDPTDMTVRDRNRAMRPFAEGCFAGIRNPAAHEHGPDWTEQQALEYLAAFSVLARWIDSCEVKHHA